MADPVLAAPPAGTPASITPSDCTEVGLTHRLAMCLRKNIDDGAQVFLGEVEPFLDGVITTVMTLAVILYGVLLSFGMVEKLGRDTMVLAIKLGCVVAFIGNGNMILDYIVTAMDSAGSTIVSYAPASGSADGNMNSKYEDATCLKNMVDQSASGINSPWLGVDCLIDSVVGIRLSDAATAGANGAATGTGTNAGAIAYNKKLDDSDPAKTQHTLARGLFGFLTATLETSILGAIITFVGFFFMYGLLMLVIKAFFTYIAGYMGVTFLVIVSPIFIPMVLFRETKQYFDKWVKLLISFALQPLISLFFIMFSLTAIDLAMFSGDYSVMYRIAGDASRQDGFNFNTYLETNKIMVPTSKTMYSVKGDRAPGINPSGVDDLYGQFRKQRFDQCKDTATLDDKQKEACTMSYPVKLYQTTIDWKKMATVRQPAVDIPADIPTTDASGNTIPDDTRGAQAISREVTAAILFACLVVFILNGLLAVVPMIAQDILGDFNQSPDIIGGEMNKMAGSRFSALKRAG